MKLSREALKKPVSVGEIQAFVRGHPEIKRWVRSFEGPVLRDVHMRNLILYCEATGLSPRGLVELRQRQKNQDAEDMLYKFVTEAESIFGVGNARIWAIAISVKNFYKWDYGIDDLAFIKLQHKLGREL